MVGGRLVGRSCDMVGYEMKRGVPVSPGVAIAPAYCLRHEASPSETATIGTSPASQEVARFDNACSQARVELDDTIARVNQQLGESSAGIFRAHRMLLDDPAIVRKVH